MQTIPKLFITDIDGVWTDGYVYVDEHGCETKRFSIADGWGASHLNALGIPWAIVTGEEGEIVPFRAKKLGCPHVFTGVEDKAEVIEELLKRLGMTASDAIYLGDDLNDLSVFGTGVPFVCPANAHPIIRAKATQVLKLTSGQGCFRELVEQFVLTPDILPGYFC